jgi:5S rRNA maturation endonuclease (ribonuclease M5)
MKDFEESAVIESLSSFLRKLNDEEDALIVVEGLRDAQALRNSGFLGELYMLCHHSNILKLEAEVSKFRKTILLLDNDSEGRKLLERTKRILNGRTRIDLFYQRELLPASKGKIRHVEELAPYAERVSRHVAGI